MTLVNASAALNLDQLRIQNVFKSGFRSYSTTRTTSDMHVSSMPHLSLIGCGGDGSHRDETPQNKSGYANPLMLDFIF